MKFLVILMAAWAASAEVVDLLTDKSQPYILASDGNSSIYYGKL